MYGHKKCRNNRPLYAPLWYDRHCKCNNNFCIYKLDRKFDNTNHKLMLLIVIFIVVLLVLCIAVMNGNSDNTKLTSPLKPQSNISRKNSNVDKVEISIEEAKELSTNPNAPLRMATDVLIAQDRGEKTFFIAPSTYKRLRGKQGQYKQFTTMKSPISQLYDLILRDDFHFSPHGCGDKAAFAKRRNKIFQKIDKALDSEKDILFTLDEISIIIKDVQYEDSQI